MAPILSPTGIDVNYCFRVEATSWDNRRFSAYIRSELRRREWTQADFARRVGVPNGTLARWLNGSRRPSSDSALRIADALNADPDDILLMTGHREAIEPVENDDQFGRIVALLKRVDLKPSARGDGLEVMLRAWIESDKAERARQAAEGES